MVVSRDDAVQPIAAVSSERLGMQNYSPMPFNAQPSQVNQRPSENNNRTEESHLE